GVIRSNDYWTTVHEASQATDLLRPLRQKVFRVDFRFSLGPFRHIGFFVIALTGNAMVFDSRVSARAVGMNVRSDVIVIKVIADIAIKLAIIEVPGISLNGAPHLAGRIRVASKGRNS